MEVLAYDPQHFWRTGQKNHKFEACVGCTRETVTKMKGEGEKSLIFGSDLNSSKCHLNGFG